MSKWILIALSFVVCATLTYSQEVSAGITGRVTDPSGAAIANASVNAKDVQRGTEWPTKTNEEGVFAFPRVPVGTYDLRIEAPGFKTSVRAGITLDVNQRARIDVAMEIGGVAETVNVASDAVLLQTEKTQVGSVIGSQTIVNTPLVSRNPIALTLLAPGVTATDPSSFNNGQRTAGGGRPYVNGNRKEANNFLLDGIDNNQTSDNLSSYQPNLDAIQEFNMITNNASAEFGNFQGGIINVIIKSGTNQFHGSVFEYFRNDKLNANNWGRNWSAQPRPALRWNQFGGTVGGPIFKDKLFFFADYQALRKTSPPTISGTTLMPAEWRRGDFSRLLDPTYSGVASGIQLYNPFQLDASGNRAPFPNNQIPMSLFSPVVQKIFADQSLYPLPQIASVARLGVDPNYFYSTASQLKSDQGDFKLDWKITNKDDFSGRYSNGRQDTPGITTLPFQYNTFNIAPFQNGVVNWTRTINPTLVNEARLGVNNIMLNNGGEDRGLGDIAQKLGIQNAGAGLLSLGSFAYTAGLGSGNIGTQQLFANTTYHLADNLTIIRGRHMMKTGGQILRQQMNTFYAGNNGRTGFMSFNGRFTQGPNAKSPTTKAVGEADFILGLPSGLGRGLSTGTWGHRKTIYGFYFQDDWRATNKLTLNLGLRWEYHTPLVEVKDRQSNFEPFTGKLLLAGKDGNSRALYAPFKKDFQPRVGFAYTVTSRMVVRGAYTISSFMEGTGTNLRLPLNPPFNSEFEARYDSPDFLLPGSTLAQGLSALNPKDPYLGANIRLWDPFVRPANTQQWNLTTEFQLPGAQVFSLAYVGQHGTHLIVPMPYFQRRLLPNGTVLPSPYLAGNTALRSAITQISGTEADGNQKYNSLQASLRKRFSKGLEYQVSYTWSKGMSDAIGYYGEGGQAGSQSAYWQNLYDRKAEWGPTYFDTTHNFVASFVYELPVGRKRTYGSDMNSFAEAIIGGWQLGGIFSAHTGFPLTIQSSSDTSGTLSRGARANVVHTPNDPHQIGPNAKWFDTTAFAIPPAGTFGNIGVGTERGPGMKRLDLTLGKRFRVFETRYVELRGEAFNLTNTPIFSGPTRSVQSSTFGEIRGAQGERNVQIAARFVF